MPDKSYIIDLVTGTALYIALLSGSFVIFSLCHARADTVCDEYGKCWEQMRPAYGEHHSNVSRFPRHHWHYGNPYGFTHSEHNGD